MDDTTGVMCAFCGSAMCLSRELPAAMATHALRFFCCETCGASELRLGAPYRRGAAKTPRFQEE
jgi:hypothetical protein